MRQHVDDYPIHCMQQEQARLDRLVVDGVIGDGFVVSTEVLWNGDACVEVMIKPVPALARVTV
jgi:hypothetical protein